LPAWLGVTLENSPSKTALADQTPRHFDFPTHDRPDNAAIRRDTDARLFRQPTRDETILRTDEDVRKPAPAIKGPDQTTRFRSCGPSSSA
jgi:hypothetical protein